MEQALGAELNSASSAQEGSSSIPCTTAPRGTSELGAEANLKRKTGGEKKTIVDAKKVKKELEGSSAWPDK